MVIRSYLNDDAYIHGCVCAEQATTYVFTIKHAYGDERVTITTSLDECSAPLMSTYSNVSESTSTPLGVPTSV